jgi:uncharacterized protein
VRPQIASLIGFALLAVAILLGAVAVAHGIRDRNQNDTISVTGSAKQLIRSDYVIWNVSVASQAQTPQAAAKTLTEWGQRVRAFLGDEGVTAAELSVRPVTAETVTDESGNGKIRGYRVTRSFEVRSPRVPQITAVVERSGRLLAEGIPIESQPLQYIYTKLADLRPRLLALATKDALGRAKVLVDATGGNLGRLRDVNVGVFQVTSPNSTDVSDYGVYDTSTLQKDVTAVVNVTFGLS